MEINKDLIISDTTTSSGDVADNISTINSNLSELNKMKSRRLVLSGTGSSGTNLTLNDGLKWSDLGRFKTLIVIVVYAPTNVTTSAIIPYDQMCNMSSTNLNENKRKMVMIWKIFIRQRLHLLVRHMEILCYFLKNY